MTATEKRERRQARHELTASLKRHVIRRIGLFSTGGQIRSGIKILSDRYYREMVKPVVEAVERQATSSPGA